MDTSSEGGILLDPSKCCKMSVEEKREFVYQIAKWPYGAPELLQSWSRQEILQILCLEMGKERKYTGLTKLKIIEQLLRIVSEKKLGESEEEKISPQSLRFSKRQRKVEIPSQLSVPTSSTPIEKTEIELEKTVICKNTACKATLSVDDKFCKRCSCCICCRYDDNKDPTLWLICSSELPFPGDSCGMSCHLECAMKNENSRIVRGVQRDDGPDGIFCCLSCRKVNDILGCWRKQLMVARDTRRVDILCYRLALTKKLTSGSQKYKEINSIVEEAVKKLEAEVGPLSCVPVKMGRGIVNRLSSGSMVQKLCISAVELLDSVLSTFALHPPPKSISQDSSLSSQNLLKIDDIGSTSIAVVLGLGDSSSGNSILYNIWHRGASESDYPLQATCTLSASNRRFTFSGLTPSTEYFFKVSSSDGTRELSSFEVSTSTRTLLADELPNQIIEARSQSPAANCSSLSNPSSVEDETNNVALCSNQNANEAGECQLASLSCPMDNEGQRPVDSADPLGATATVLTAPDSDATNPENKEKTAEDTSTDDDGPGKECVPFVGSSKEASLPITPCKVENNNSKDGCNRAGRPKPCSNKRDRENGFRFGSTSKKRRGESVPPNPINNDGQSPNRDFEFYVKVIRWLECEGHIEKNFRQKFLTWYSLRATPHEVRIVKVFIDTFMEDPTALAEQLMDTFSDCVSSKGSSPSNVPSGFCMKPWH
ncbi:hypothetical protein SAY87_009520 [Trapa incisa]|uniref:Fibronectin type-III domain-containing protein n=1 Tax=Trapa incisa TaxID=236973 RepID=A0AAN7PY30_9MYRT|nr:hypothetical protein SAY87_009520 [Trapa incisa]